MNRRKFCKLASLAAVASALKGSAAVVAPAVASPSPLRRCRVTVLRRECFSDLQSRYLDDPETGRCAHFCEGQEFDIDSIGEMPAGFCPNAWECIKSHVANVLDTGNANNCGVSSPDNAVIACCNDGTRPVIFKIRPLQG